MTMTHFSRTIATQSQLLKTVCAAPVIIALSFLSGCAAGPDYVRPVTISAVDMPANFKENFKLAEPQDNRLPEEWWRLFNDPTLNDLIAQCN